MKSCRLILPIALAGLLAPLGAEPVQVAILPAKVVPEQAATLHLENGVLSRLADASRHQEAGAVVAVLNEERTAQEREELELKLARESIRLRDEMNKLEVQRNKVEFYLNLSQKERRYAANLGAGDMPPTQESLRDIDERMALLKREMETAPRLMKQEFERSHAKLTLRMPFAGRLQYNFTPPEDTTKPFEYQGLPGRSFATICDDSAFYITVNISQAELTQLAEKNFSVSIDLPEGRRLTGQFSHRKVEQSSHGNSDMLVYYFKVPQADHETAFSMMGSNAKARLVYDAGENVEYVSKMELIAHPEAAQCENWEQLVARLYPNHHLVLIGERNIIIRPRNP